MLEKTYVETLDEIITENNSELFEKKIKIITEAIAKLPRKCKETLLLSKKEGLTNIEIAEYHNVSIRTVEWQLNKAYNLLRDCVNSQPDFLVLFILVTSIFI